MSKFWSIDPGGNISGLAVVHTAPQTYLLKTHSVSGGAAGFEQFLLRSWNNEFDLSLPDFIICEDFIPGKEAGLNYDPLEIKGALRLWCSQNSIPLRMQTPAGRKEAVSDHMMKKIGIWPTQKDEKEAARHALWYLKGIRHPAIIGAFQRNAENA